MRRPALLPLLVLAACTEPVRDPGSLRADAGASDARTPDAAPRDAAPDLDGGAQDAVAPDAAALDASAPDAELADQGVACGLDQPGPADRDRVLLVGQPFSRVAGQDGTEIRSLSYSTAGVLADDGVRLDVGFRPVRIEMSLDGSYGLVLGENGELASVRVTGVRTLTLIDRVTLPSAGYGDLRVWADGQTIFAVGSNVDTTSGISTVRLSCDGTLTVVDGEFFNLRLADSLAFLPDPRRAILLGGQTAFAPLDADDVRLLEYTAGSGWTQLDAFDIYADFIDALRIAVSPDGSTLLIPNGSPFSNDASELAVVSISGNTLTESARLMGLEDAREALFSSDGHTALVSLLQPGQIVVLSDDRGTFAEVDRLGGIGLAENMALLARGALRDRVFVTSVDASGEPNITVVRISGPGVALVAGMTNLGTGAENIPGGVAIQP